MTDADKTWECGDGLTATLSGNTLTISGSGEIDDYSAVSYAPWCKDKADRTSIRNVVIESGVTSIGKYAFYECTSLTSVSIPDTVTSISNGVFSGCTSLASITIPSSVTDIRTGTLLLLPMSP